MSKNIVNEIISIEDMKVIRNIARKYNMSLIQFCRFIAKSTDDKGYRACVRLSDSEYNVIKEKSERLGVSLSKYCAVAVAEYVHANKLNNIDFTSNVSDKSSRKKSIYVTFQQKRDFKELWDFSKIHSVSFSSSIRYCAVNFEKE